MNKFDLAKAIHEEIGITSEEANKVVAFMFDKIVEACDNGDEVNIPRFGIFYVTPAKDFALRVGKVLRHRYKDKAALNKEELK